MTSPDEASRPGPPPTLWAPSLVLPGTLPPFYTGHAIWNRHQEVWQRMAAYEVYGNHCPDDSILLGPETPADGAPDLASRVTHLEDLLKAALARDGNR